MPEGPEVKLLVKLLNKELTNEIIIDIKIDSGRYHRNKRFEGLKLFKDHLPLKITGI